MDVLKMQTLGQARLERFFRRFELAASTPSTGLDTMSEHTVSISHTARNMMVSLNDGTTDTSLEEIEDKVRSIVELPDARPIDGHDNVFFAVDDDYLVIFERQGGGVLIRSVAEAAGYPGLITQRSR